MQTNHSRMDLEPLPSHDSSARSLKLVASRTNYNSPFSDLLDFNANPQRKESFEEFDSDHPQSNGEMLLEHVARGQTSGQMEASLNRELQTAASNFMEGIKQDIPQDTFTSRDSDSEAEFEPLTKSNKRSKGEESKAKEEEKILKQFLMQAINAGKDINPNEEKLDALYSLLEAVFTKGAEKAAPRSVCTSFLSKIADDKALQAILLCLIEGGHEMLQRNPTFNQVVDLVSTGKPFRRAPRKDECQKKILSKHQNIIYDYFHCNDTLKPEAKQLIADRYGKCLRRKSIRLTIVI